MLTAHLTTSFVIEGDLPVVPILVDNPELDEPHYKGMQATATAFFLEPEDPRIMITWPDIGDAFFVSATEEKVKEFIKAARKQASWMLRFSDENEKILFEETMEHQLPDPTGDFAAALVKKGIGDSSTAITLLMALEKKLPRTTGIHLNLAEILRRKGRLMEAEIGYKKELEIKKKGYYASKAFEGLGLMAQTKRDKKKAEDFMRKALQLNPNSYSALCSFAALSKDRALAALTRAHAINPMGGGHLRVLGGLYPKGKAWAEAFDKITADAPNVDKSDPFALD